MWVTTFQRSDFRQWAFNVWAPHETQGSALMILFCTYFGLSESNKQKMMIQSFFFSFCKRWCFLFLLCVISLSQQRGYRTRHVAVLFLFCFFNSTSRFWMCDLHSPNASLGISFLLIRLYQHRKVWEEHTRVCFPIIVRTLIDTTDPRPQLKP